MFRIVANCTVTNCTLSTIELVAIKNGRGLFLRQIYIFFQRGGAEQGGEGRVPQFNTRFFSFLLLFFYYYWGPNSGVIIRGHIFGFIVGPVRHLAFFVITLVSQLPMLAVFIPVHAAVSIYIVCSAR